MPDNPTVTQNHDEIRTWIMNNNGIPALVGDPSVEGAPVGLRIDFPGAGDESLLGDSQQKPDIGWDEFFRIFDEKRLAFVYYRDPTVEDKTLLYRFVPRDTLGDMNDL